MKQSFWKRMCTKAKRAVHKAEMKWKTMSGADKAKFILTGMAGFGCGWIAADMVDDQHGVIPCACTYVAASALSGAGAMVSAYVIDKAVDSYTNMSNEMKKEDADA